MQLSFGCTFCPVLYVPSTLLVNKTSNIYWILLHCIGSSEILHGQQRLSNSIMWVATDFFIRCIGLFLWRFHRDGSTSCVPPRTSIFHGILWNAIKSVRIQMLSSNKAFFGRIARIQVHRLIIQWDSSDVATGESHGLGGYEFTTFTWSIFDSR